MRIDSMSSGEDEDDNEVIDDESDDEEDETDLSGMPVFDLSTPTEQGIRCAVPSGSTPQ